MTDIQDAYVNAAQEYDDPRVPGGKVPSGLAQQSALPLFADNSYYLYAEYSGMNAFGGLAGIRIQHSHVGESLNQLTDGFTSPRLTQGDYDITDAVITWEKGDWSAQLRFNNISDERGLLTRIQRFRYRLGPKQLGRHQTSQLRAVDQALLLRSACK